MIDITIKRNNRTDMVKKVKEEITRALSSTEPAFNSETDDIKLSKCTHTSDHLKLSYEILRDVRRHKSRENLSPYRELGLTMQVGRNS